MGQATRAEYIRTNGWNCGYVLTLANGSAIIRTLERDWERPQLVTRVLTTFNGNTIRDYRYAYDILGRITNRIDNGVQMNTFAYNPRSEVLYALFGTNETDYAYDDIGNHSLYPANNLNQYVDNAIEYDADGNMTRCGTWTFGWGAENRLISAAEGTTSIANAYDYKHRRVRKTVGSESHAFVYDGWNLLGETVNDTELTHYFWGLDLSDSLQGAGGVGGLLAVSQDGAMYYPVYDNNGNVTAYLNDSGNIVASYEYNAFGEAISQSGSLANEFAFRFSTKYHDNETGLCYYGYRFYNPVLRTWLNRDPIEEEGGLNLYGFNRNDGVNHFDLFGLDRWEWWFIEVYYIGKFKLVSINPVDYIKFKSGYMKAVVFGVSLIGRINDAQLKPTGRPNPLTYQKVPDCYVWKDTKSGKLEFVKILLGSDAKDFSLLEVSALFKRRIEHIYGPPN